ncbi:PD-(D/E)XK nuclease family protein [uncultured Pedobacter sp.]|uniref:PD-(D/E)XK nuclease family protein n=1 Tax=uncultured Pedobacter sp. TaxID=246139 RepID=UPI00260248F5|nr:PD-(D/E)XK nuclease family protein [uncultured Pedobacter sp.]
MKAFLKEVAEDLVAKFGDKIQDCAIVFNNKRPASYLQKHLADIYQKPFWSPNFYTIQEFFAEASSLKIADQYTQFFTLFDCYTAILKAEKVDKLPSIGKFHQIAKIILGDFSQIDNDLVDADKLFLEMEDIAVINQQFDFLTEEQKMFLSQFWNSYSEGKLKKQQEAFIKMWRRMPQLFSTFHEQLKNKGFITMARLYKEIANAQNDIDFTSKYENEQLIFVGFNALSKAEAKAFKRWQEEGKAIFYFDTDSYYLEDEMQEAGLFLRRNLKKLGLKNQTDINHSFIKSVQREVNVYKVQGQTAQAKILSELLKDELQLIQDKQVVPSTAIILADESLLLPVLQTIPGTEKNQVNVTMGFSLLLSPIYGLVDIWLTAQSQLTQIGKTINFKTAEAFLSHPLTGIDEKMRNKIKIALTKEQLVEIPFERLTRQKYLLATFFKPTTSKTAVLDLSKILDQVLQSLLAAKALKVIEANLFAKTIQELNKLHDKVEQHMESYDNQVELSFVLSLIQKSLADVSVPFEGDALSGLQIMGLLESRNLNFDRVIVLGLNEGIMPQASVGTTFIPDSLRRAYGLPILENQDAISAYMFYRLIQRSKQLDFVYNCLTDDSNSGEPSRFVKQLEYESGFNFHHKELQLAVKTELKREEVIVKTEKVQQILQLFLNGTRTLSASALTTYILNPIDFFYKYIAGIEEPQEIEETVEAKKLGLILHYAMEQFYEQLRAENPEITAERIEQKKTAINGLIIEGFADCLIEKNYKETKQERLQKVRALVPKIKLNGMEKVVMAIVQEYIQIILAQDIASAPFTLISLEQTHFTPFKITVAGTEQTIKLKGIIDRVDLKDGVYRIVDYKTGSDVLKYTSIEESFDTDNTKINKALIQTLLYTHVYEQATKKIDVEPNLYVVKNMRTEGVNFKKGKEGELLGAFLANEKQVFLDSLRKKLEELFNYDIPFKASAKPKNYSYSIYKTLFGG